LTRSYSSLKGPQRDFWPLSKKTVGSDAEFLASAASPKGIELVSNWKHISEFLWRPY